MARTILAAAAFVSALAIPAHSEGDFDLLVRPQNAAAVSTWYAPASRSATKAAVIDAAQRYGVPVDVADYHARRESGYRANARNPRSTATGVLQVVKGSHEAIIGHRLTLTQHVRLMSDPAHGAAVGMAHVAACREARPGWTPGQLWLNGHVGGLVNCGTTLERAAQLYRQNG